jgi:hypothetical protein
MKHVLILGLLFCARVIPAQVELMLAISRSLAPGSENTLRVKIAKGTITEFSKFEMLVPEGWVITGKETMSGSFSFEEHHAKLIWAITPSDEVLALSFNLAVPSSASGSHSLMLRYNYIDPESKRETEAEPFVVQVTGDAVADTSAEFVRLNSTTMPPVTMPVAKPVNLNTKDNVQRKMYPHQLRKDSREAFKVGEKEKARAMEDLEDANTILRQAEYIDDQMLREKVVSHVGAAKKRAEIDVQMAEKILALAQSLEDEAARIQKENIEKGLEPATETTPDGVVYRVQVGAFTKRPGSGAFNAIGKVNVLNENGLYKVMLGNFTSRDAARSKRAEIVEKGFDAFVVGYRNGVRME